MKPKKPVRAAATCTVCLIAYCAVFWPFLGIGWNWFPLAIGYSVLLSFATIGVIMDGSLGKLHGIHLVIWLCTTAISIFLPAFLMPNKFQMFGFMVKLLIWLAVACIFWVASVAIRGWIKVFLRR